ncbi:hypothetical protein GCM10011508_05520 [Flavobacterium lutivivi]|nr:hypothetical protein GCM10011508_05520 [Flavobacterium lutivivi]
MKTVFRLLIFLIIYKGFSQENGIKMPLDAKKIYFEFKKHSNYSIINKKVYADTILFKIDFPDLKSTLCKNPNDSLKICSFIPVEKFLGENKVKLLSILYHGNESIFGTVYLEKNKTILNYQRDDDETRRIFTELFKEKYVNFSYQVEIDYKRKKVYYNYPNVKYEKTFDDLDYEIIFYSEDKLRGN